MVLPHILCIHLRLALFLLKYGYSEDVVIVGILHDVIEDTKFSEIDIRKRFGKRISTMVLGVTENNKITSNKEKFKLYKYNLKNLITIQRPYVQLICCTIASQF